MITPIQKNRVFEDVAAQIKTQIEEGHWQEGEKIQSEMELSRLFQVSRGSIREAITSLQTLGILEAFSGQGTFVSPNALQKIRDNKFTELLRDESKYDDILECRYVIETQAAVYAAANCTEKDIAFLTETYEQMMTYTEQGEVSSYNECGHQFHSYIVHMMDNDVLTAFYDSIAPRFVEERRSFSEKKDLPEVLQAHNDHKMLIDAFARHDVKGARQIMNRHLGSKIMDQKWQFILKESD